MLYSHFLLCDSTIRMVLEELTRLLYIFQPRLRKTAASSGFLSLSEYDVRDLIFQNNFSSRSGQCFGFIATNLNQSFSSRWVISRKGIMEFKSAVVERAYRYVFSSSILLGAIASDGIYQ